MAGQRKIGIVALIVIAGIVAALPFARRGEWIDEEEPAPPVESRAVPLQLAAESATSPAVGLNDQDSPAVTLPRIAALPAQPSRLQDDGAPPELPDRYHPLLENAPSRTPVAPVVSRPPATLELDEPQVRIQRPAELPPPMARTHRVNDGDTLARIAQRYYGDSALADRLYAANRDVLSSPDPLPIGVMLRIPAP